MEISQDYFSPLDRRFAAFIEGLSGGSAPEVFLAAALSGRFRDEGHVCIDLATLAGNPFAPDDPDTGAPVVCPSLEKWITALRNSPAVGRPGDFRPLVLDETRLYLHRYWAYEQRVVDRLRKSAAWTNPDVDETLLCEGLNRLFPLSPAIEPQPDLRKRAAAVAVLKQLCVISGGPGTGKTTTVAGILAILLEQAKAFRANQAGAIQSGAIQPDPIFGPIREAGAQRLRIALAAPTGKAAARLQEAIGREKAKLSCAEDIRDGIPSHASTLHRLLGLSGISAGTRSEALLPVDVLVIDEASMVDLPLLARVVRALPEHSRLILLGDRDQLASVEAGAVLGDICGAGRAFYSGPLRTRLELLAGERAESNSSGSDRSEAAIPHPLSFGPPVGDCIVQLERSYRFGEESGIGKLSRKICEGDGSGAITVLKGGQWKDIVWRELPHPDAMGRGLRERLTGGFADFLRCSDPGEALDRFNRFRILCAVREGPYGVRSLNRHTEQILGRAGLIRPDEKWYRGRPVVILKNDYGLQLFNGDVGIALPDPEAPETEDQLRVFFRSPEGLLRKFPPLRIPEHETVYAMTVHKSQGSEFDEVLFVLPDRPAPVLTRELLYTGITRARQRAEIWAREGILRLAAERRIKRMSGLGEALWKGDPAQPDPQTL